jgi:hypothetical protein
MKTFISFYRFIVWIKFVIRWNDISKLLLFCFWHIICLLWHENTTFLNLLGVQRALEMFLFFSNSCCCCWVLPFRHSILGRTYKDIDILQSHSASRLRVAQCTIAVYIQKYHIKLKYGYFLISHSLGKIIHIFSTKLFRKKTRSDIDWFNCQVVLWF